jgi:hypothetical protein
VSNDHGVEQRDVLVKRTARPLPSATFGRCIHRWLRWLWRLRWSRVLSNIGRCIHRRLRRLRWLWRLRRLRWRLRRLRRGHIAARIARQLTWNHIRLRWWIGVVDELVLPGRAAACVRVVAITTCDCCRCDQGSACACQQSRRRARKTERGFRLGGQTRHHVTTLRASIGKHNLGSSRFRRERQTPLLSASRKGSQVRIQCLEIGASSPFSVTLLPLVPKRERKHPRRWQGNRREPPRVARMCNSH